MQNRGFIQSAGYIAQGWRLVRTPGLRRFVWMPLLINFLVFGALGWWISTWASSWLDSLALFSQWGDWWLVAAFRSLLQWIMSIVLIFSLAYFFTLLANLIGAPFNGLLAERVEAHLSGDTSPPAPPVMTLIKSIPRLMWSEMSKLAYLVICIVPLLLLQFVPVIQLVAPFLLFLFAAWMFALEYLDYPMGNSGAVFRDVRRSLRKKRRTAYGFGSAVALVSMVPILNLVIMPVAVAGATALYVDNVRDDFLAKA